MTQRCVTRLEIDQGKAASFHFLQTGMTFLYARVLPDVRVLYLSRAELSQPTPTVEGRLRVGVARDMETHYYDQVWEFDQRDEEAAWRAVLGWDGEGDPEGWTLTLPSGRTQRPSSDA